MVQPPGIRGLSLTVRYPKTKQKFPGGFSSFSNLPERLVEGYSVANPHGETGIDGESVVCSLLVRKVIVALIFLVGFQPGLVDMSAGRLLRGLYVSLRKGPTLGGGVDWPGSSVCAEKSCPFLCTMQS